MSLDDLQDKIELLEMKLALSEESNTLLIYAVAMEADAETQRRIQIKHLELIQKIKIIPQ